MADHYRGTTAERGDDIVGCITHEKRLKRWRRQWKFELIERAIQTGGTCSICWRETEAGPRIKSGVTQLLDVRKVVVS